MAWLCYGEIQILQETHMHRLGSALPGGTQKHLEPPGVEHIILEPDTWGSRCGIQICLCQDVAKESHKAM